MPSLSRLIKFPAPYDTTIIFQRLEEDVEVDRDDELTNNPLEIEF